MNIFNLSTDLQTTSRVVAMAVVVATMGLSLSNVSAQNTGHIGFAATSSAEQPPTGLLGIDPDADFDGVVDALDNCIDVANANQFDADNDGYGNACDPDLNNDCVVNFVDVSAMTSVFFCTDDSAECQNADLDGSGSVNFIDYSMLTSEFLEPPGDSALEDLCSFPLVVNQPLTLRGTWTYDMDTGTEGVVINPPEADMWFERLTSSSGNFAPRNGTSFALIGANRPTVNECLSVNMTSERIPQSAMEVGDWFCMRNNGGTLSRFQITSGTSLPLNTAQNMDIHLTTWECESCEAGFDPAGVEGLVAWFDADHAPSVELNGSTLVNWQDRSGTIPSMSSLTSDQRPGFTPNGINGRGSVTFDGINDRLFAGSNTNLGDGYTVFIAARNDVRQNYNGLLSLRGTASGQQAGFEVYWQAGTTDSASGNIVVAANRGTSGFAYIESHDAGPAIGSAYTMATRVSANFSTQQIHMDGIDQSLVTGGSNVRDLTPNAARQLVLGQGFGSTISGTVLEGEIGEVLVFDRALTDAEFDFVSTYIDNKWAQD